MTAKILLCCVILLSILMDFEQNDVSLEQDLAIVEQYLVKVLPGVKSKTYASMSANLKMCYYRLVQLSLGISKEHSF